MLSTKITYALADWIKDWIKTYGNKPEIEHCLKYVTWKIGNDYQLTESDKNIVKTILIYNTEQ